MNESGTDPAKGLEPPGLPRWVKISGAVLLLLLLAVILVMIASGGKHGPGRHGAQGAGTTPYISVALSPRVPV